MKLTFEVDGTKAEIDVLNFQLGMSSRVRIVHDPDDLWVVRNTGVWHSSEWSNFVVTQKFDKNAVMMEKWRGMAFKDVTFQNTDPDKLGNVIFDIKFGLLQWLHASTKVVDTSELYAGSAAHGEDEMTVQVITFKIGGTVSFKTHLNDNNIEKIFYPDHND